MKKRNIALTGIITALLLTGCQTSTDTSEAESLKQPTAQLEQQTAESEQEGTKDANTDTTAVVPEAPQTATTPADASSDSGSTTNTLEELTTMVDNFVAKAEETAPGTDDAANMETFFSLKQEGNQIDNALDLHEDELENQYRAGTLTRDDYRQSEQELERLEDLLDDAEDRLEYTFGIDD